MHVVATAGHVDHGKSTLVLALTGTDPDRWAQEKQRGLTIDLGFATTTLDSGAPAPGAPGIEVGFVDVPGHTRFVKNMLAGVGAVDACLFVVAATEGWKPQSEEHLRILDLLGVRHGVIALTKVAALDADRVALARLEVEEAVVGTFLAGAEVVDVDAPTGQGLAELRGALARLLGQVPTAQDWGRPRLWVDRSFAVRGSGTVVTGTLTGGSLGVGAEVVVIGPGGGVSGRIRAARLRGLQSHGRSLVSAGPGRRLALNLTGIGRGEVTRGDAVLLAGQWEPTRTLDCSLSVLGALGHEVSQRGAYQAYIGSGEYPVRIRLLAAPGAGPAGAVRTVGPGGSGLVRLHLPVALALVPGDRYVLRESGRAETVGGGEVLDVAPVLPASRARPDRSVERVLAERGWVEVDLLERLTGERRPATLAGRWCVDPAARAETGAEVSAAIAAAGRAGLDLAGLDEFRRAVTESLPDVVIEGGRAWLGGGPSGGGRFAGHPFLLALRASPFAPPSPDGVERAELREMARTGLVVEADGAWFAQDAVTHAAEVLASLLAERPEGVTVAEVRDALGTTRRWVIPLLSHLDATGVTRRRGNLRVGGPALPSRRATGPGAPPPPASPSSIVAAPADQH